MTANTQDRDWFQDPPPRRVGALALITRGTQLLMVSRPYRAAVSRWGLPGGSTAANELPRAAVSRLLADRLSLRATAGRLIVVDHVPEKPGQHREGTNFVYPDVFGLLPSEASTEQLADCLAQLPHQALLMNFDPEASTTELVKATEHIF
jgi:ADP-ribose pyrophosphatase YjhB (NUDIX family)